MTSPVILALVGVIDEGAKELAELVVRMVHVGSHHYILLSDISFWMLGL